MDNVFIDAYEWLLALLGQRTTEKNLARAGKKVGKALGHFDKVVVELEKSANNFGKISIDLQAEIEEVEEELKLKRDALIKTDKRVVNAQNTAGRVREVFGLVRETDEDLATETDAEPPTEHPAPASHAPATNTSD